MTRILVTGASGLLGANLILEAYGAGHTVVASSRSRQIDHPEIVWIPAELTSPGAVVDLFNAARPDWVVHSAAATDVDRCEADPEWAFGLNRDVAGYVAAAALKRRARLVHVSTDAVFDGEGGPYSETDPARPVNAYGESKLAGEAAVIEAYPGAAIVRTNFYGWSQLRRPSLMEWFLNKLRARDPCIGFTDVWINPVSASQLARILLLMLERGLSGIHHIGCRECVSKYEFGLAVAETFELDASIIRRGTSGEGELTAQRPGRLCLDVSSAEHELGIRVPRLADGLDEMVELEQQGYAARLAGIVREPA